MVYSISFGPTVYIINLCTSKIFAEIVCFKWRTLFILAIIYNPFHGIFCLFLSIEFLTAFDY
ncbi:expressed protein, partial [Phakopsora pachyrhizi]